MTDVNPEHTFGHTIAFGEEYYQNAIEILRAIGADDALVEVARRAVEALRHGHKVYANISIGHMPTYELDDKREGNPLIFASPQSGSFTPEELETLGEGDVLLTCQTNAAMRQARDRGAYVVSFTTPYRPNSKTPPDKLNPNEDNLLPEDVASCVIDSHVSWEHGLVHIPQVPEMAVFPGSTIGGCAIHWMLTAEVGHALATDSVPDGRSGRHYIDTLLERLADFRSQDRASIEKLAETIAKRIIGGGRYFVRSRNEGVQSEAESVAQGLMLCNALEQRPDGEGGAADIFLIVAVLPDEPQELAWADAARANGNLVVGIGPAASSGLRQRCDVYFDNRCDEPAGVVAIPGRDEKVSPASGIVNLIIMYVLTAQFVDEMCRRGAVPYFWMGYHWLGGAAYNEVMGPFFRQRGY
jgi:uncharacterized phosphosugar-binding protein